MPLTKKEAASIARRAFENGKAADFLSGKGEYTIPVNQFIPADIPTDFEYAIRVALFGYYNETKDESIPKQYAQAIEQLLAGDCLDIWCAYKVCHYQIEFEMRNESPFNIMSKELTAGVSLAVKKNKTDIEACKLREGRGNARGLMQDIEAWNKGLLKEYGVSLL